MDWPPFRAAFAAKAPAVMTAHVLTPALSPDKLPATLSSRILGGVLRGRLGFNGVIFTDSLGMGHPTFLPTQSYPDQVLRQIAEIVAAKTHKTERDVFLNLGRYTVKGFHKLYPQFFKAKTLKDFYLSMLDGIGQQFVDEQAKGNGLIERQKTGSQLAG